MRSGRLSRRPYLALAHTKLAFETKLILLDRPTRAPTSPP